MPREFLEFLCFDPSLIDEIMDYQEKKLLPVENNNGIYDMADSLLYGNEVDKVLVRRSDNQLEDVKAFLRLLLSQEQVYKVKVDCIQKNLGSPTTVAMNINATRFMTAMDNP